MKMPGSTGFEGGEVPQWNVYIRAKLGCLPDEEDLARFDEAVDALPELVACNLEFETVAELSFYLPGNFREALTRSVTESRDIFRIGNIPVKCLAEVLIGSTKTFSKQLAKNDYAIEDPPKKLWYEVGSATRKARRLWDDKDPRWPRWSKLAA